MQATPTLRELRGASLGALEQLYREAPVLPVPAVRCRGQVLCRVGTRFARSATATGLLLPFERLPFGVDFRSRTWWFVHPGLRLGRFRVEPGPSRWRDTGAQRLRYDGSRLPIRGLLYDEVKPLGAALCLGLGGIDREVGQGDLFFFALWPVRP